MLVLDCLWHLYCVRKHGGRRRRRSCVAQHSRVCRVPELGTDVGRAYYIHPTVTMQCSTIVMSTPRYISHCHKRHGRVAGCSWLGEGVKALTVHLSISELVYGPPFLVGAGSSPRPAGNNTILCSFATKRLQYGQSLLSKVCSKALSVLLQHPVIRIR